MERDYFILRTRAAPARTLERLADEIRRDQLGEEVPLIMIEKEIKRANRAQEFYLVLVVDTKNGFFSEELSSLVRTVFGHPNIVNITREEARQFANVGLDFIDNVVLIPFDPPRPTLPELLNFSDEEEIVSTQHISEQSSAQQYQNLLYWLSFTQQGTIMSFQRACVSLGLIGENDSCRPLIRRLRLLGHLELATDGNHWAMSPPCLIYRTLENGHIRASLCGQRSIRFIESIKSVCSSPEQLSLQPSGDGPPTIFFNFENREELTETRSSLEGPSLILTSATQLAEILPKLDEWKSSLPIAEGITPALYEKRFWQSGAFKEVQLVEQSGFYELRRCENERGGSSCFYYDKNSGNWLQGDWYGLRFLTLSETGHAEAYFVQDRLAVPLNKRWPYLYEKSLVLISGSLPERMGNWLAYSDITLSTAEALCRKLGAELKVM